MRVCCVAFGVTGSKPHPAPPELLEADVELLAEVELVLADVELLAEVELLLADVELLLAEAELVVAEAEVLLAEAEVLEDDVDVPPAPLLEEKAEPVVEAKVELRVVVFPAEVDIEPEPPSPVAVDDASPDPHAAPIEAAVMRVRDAVTMARRALFFVVWRLLMMSSFSGLSTMASGWGTSI